jgi:peptidoglycan/LPS O-acetylase OafA/YrhL
MSLPTERRFLLIDGLRGIAAMAVVFYHFHEAITRSTDRWLPEALDVVFRRGYLGVDIFFVISGFVIAYSIRNGDFTPNYLFRFWLRRSIRLDPPYWLTIAVEIALIVICLALIPSLRTPIPSARDVVAHLFYAQNILGYKNVLPIFWTLCYEVQFYMFVVGLMVVWQSVRGSLSAFWIRALPPVALTALFVASLILRYTTAELPVPGIALDRWFQFFLGVLVWWHMAGKVSAKPLALAWTATIVFIVLTRQPAAEQLVGIVASAVVFVAAKRDQLGSWLAARPIQFLGKISYSLYLLHLPIGWRFVALCEHLLGGKMSTLVAWLVFGGGVAVSIISASISYYLLEAPSMRLSKHIRMPTGKTVSLPSRMDPAAPTGLPLPAAPSAKVHA